MKAYLLLRVRLVGRQLTELGWWRLALLGGLLVVALGRALVVLAAYPAGLWLVPLVVVLLTLSQHRRRSDLDFLHLTAPNFRPWLAVEYALWSLPATLALLVLSRVEAGLLTVALPPLAAWLPAARARATTRQRRSEFRSEALELVSGFRQTGAWLWWLALLGTAAWWRQYPAGPALALGVWVLLFTSFYGVPESWTLLLPALRRPGAWLRRRVGLAVVYNGLTAAPFAWLMGQNAAGPGAALLLWLWGAVVVTMVVLARYAFYPSALLVRLSQGGIVALALLGTAHPVYPALLLVVFLGLMWKSQQRLSIYRLD